MLADEPNLRVYERAFSGRNSGKGGAPGLQVPVVLGARDFARPATVAVAATPNCARAAGRKFAPLARQWQRIPGPLATLAGVAALPLRAALWGLKRWKWVVAVALLALVVIWPHMTASVQRKAPVPEGEQMLHAAARYMQAAHERGGAPVRDLVDDLGFDLLELQGRYYRVSREVLTTGDGKRLIALPMQAGDPVLVLDVPHQGDPVLRQLTDKPQ